jgi:hypothetical protein
MAPRAVAQNLLGFEQAPPIFPNPAEHGISTGVKSKVLAVITGNG